MKKYSNAIFVVFLIIFAAGLWLFNSNITRVPLLSDDNFYFVKRKDKQIKYKGYRVEILDIENNLYNLEYFEKVKVITKENNNEVCKLIAFVKLKDNISIDSINIKEKLRQKLPEYMIPVIRIINEFPINSNGKVDINKLKEEI